MKIKIPARLDAPETNLYVEIITKDVTPLGGRSVMLLVPGGPGGNHTVYDAVKEELLKYSDLILFDPRGCGLSDFSDPTYCTIDHYINDIEAIRNHFQLNKIILMGGSYGAMASIGYATQYSKCLEKLILIGGSPSYRFLETAKKNLKNRGEPEQIAIAENLWNGTFKDADHFTKYYKILASMYIYKQKRQDYVPSTKKNIPYNIAVTNLGFGNFLRKFDFERDLAKIKCETLILSGKNDWINDPSHAIVMANGIPKSNLIIFDDCGHFIWEDQREKFFNILSEFMTLRRDYEPIMRSRL